MHEIIFYKNTKGKQPVLEYMQELSKSNGKDSRIKLNKINDYIQALSVYGTEQLSETYVKHLDGDIWELRPLRDRILFAGVVDGRYVLLHQFMKKTQKTPIREIRKAKNELKDFKERSGWYGAK
ncbi:MAG: type II toxin-antitoxin system RelE/ParE family toxin [Lachnospiraceae bacterium]|nr:type II toxin-antitoxin system RelE/ParE family toxin [Lachnospiraceae bacterium]